MYTASASVRPVVGRTPMGLKGFKQRLGRSAPRWIVRLYRRLASAGEFWSDYRDYAASTAWDMGAGRPDDRRDDLEALRSRLTIAYHGLEKGASFASPRQPYGLAKQAEISSLLTLAPKETGLVSGIRYAEEAVEAVSDFNRSGRISGLVTPESEWDGRVYDFSEVERFVSTRHSVRDFDSERGVEMALIQEVTRLAGMTPSVCNRRPYRVHYFDNREMIDRLLALQNGNLGFGHAVPGLLLVTVRRSSFVGAGERNQRWIDGGLFAMTLVWLLHAAGLGSCFLNWSQTNAQTDRLRSVGSIPKSEDVVVLIALGYAREGHRVARSPLRPLNEIWERHQ